MSGDANAGPTWLNGEASAPQVSNTYEWTDASLGGSVRQRRTGVDEPKYVWDPGLGEHRQADLIFGLDNLDALGEAPYVVLCEGAKAAAAARDAGLPAVGLVSASTVPSRYVIERLAGRTIVMWPDNDGPGRALMGKTGELLERAGVASLHFIQWAEAPEHGDAADAPAQRIRELVDEALERLYVAPTKPGTEVDLLDRREDAGQDDGEPVARRETVGIDAADLVALELPPLRTVVPPWLVEGTTIIAAPPKVGKSCLVYQVVVEVALGGMLFGRRCNPGSALYLALEDGRRRGQSRLLAALHGRTMPRGRLEVRWSARRIGEGLEDDLAAWLDAHPDAAVVAIDTLQKARPRTNGKRGAYEVDVDDLGRLQSVFRDRSVALVVVHHSRKESGDDFLTSVSGTYGITGSADSTVVVRRKRMEAFGTIVATGRDIPEIEMSARFDGMLWHQAPPAIAEASVERTEVYQVVEADGPIFAKAIADRLDLERTSVQHMLEALVASGAVARVPRGYVAVRADATSRARAYESHPGHSNHWESDRSDRGHARAQARGNVSERMGAIFTNEPADDDEPDPAAVEAMFRDLDATWTN